MKHSKATQSEAVKTMHRKTIALFIAAILISSTLTACANSGSGVTAAEGSISPNSLTVSASALQAHSPTAVVTPPTSPISALGAYKAVLQGKAEFFSTATNKNLNIDQMNPLLAAENVITTVEKFALIDLDHDGTPEVVLWLNVGGNDSLAFEILHYEDGVVYGFTFFYRAFNDLKSDGTFTVSSGAGDWGFCTTQFVKKHVYNRQIHLL